MHQRLRETDTTFRPLIMLLPFLALLLSTCSLLPSNSGNNHGRVDTIPFETLRKEYVASLTDSAGYAVQPETFVLRSERDERSFLAAHPQDSLPDIDYSEHIVVGVLAGARPNTSYEVTIDSVTVGTEVGAEVVVYSTEMGSGAGGRAITHPAHIVALRRSSVAEREIDFAEIERVCQMSPCIWEWQ